MRRIAAATVCASVLLYAAVLVRADALRPFALSLEGFANPQFTGPCSIVNDETGSGHATHLGAIAFQSHETVDLCSNPDGGEVTGTFTLTAANGDQLFGSYETIGVFNFGNNQVKASGRYRVAGGTGRFAAASGGGDIKAVGSLLPPFE